MSAEYESEAQKRSQGPALTDAVEGELFILVMPSGNRQLMRVAKVNSPGAFVAMPASRDDAMGITPQTVLRHFDTRARPPRPPAPWQITHRDGAWWIEKRHTDHYEPHCRLETGAEAIATFAARWTQ
ncbi:hypothetical protein [Mycobacteroides sp. PCS013]|uniref:hypothetical protein n=1 Tax=Mycobacteroides sp. PCS013 TaxID=3074106 RepID=UPI003C2ACBC0